MNTIRDWPVASVSSIIIRGLPGNTTEREVKSLLLFTKDLLQSGLRPPSPGEESAKQVSAWATFTSHEAALQARTALNGKQMAQGFLSVDLDKGSRPPIGTRRNTTDGGTISSQGISPSAQQSHQMTDSTGLTTIYAGAKYNQYPPGVDFSPPPSLESGSNYTDQLYSNPQSPVQYGEAGSLGYMLVDPAANTKALIAQDSDIDTAMASGLYLQDHPGAMPLIANSKPRRATNPQPGMAQFGALSTYGLTTSGMNHLGTNPISMAPNNTMSGTPVASPIGPPPPNHSSFLFRQNRMLPAVNPSDQNPPCNTLYVGNLPVGTSEDELKALFSRQRGYKRLCFRTKQNGPMCFVEFEDIGFATKALTELYGHNLSNSVKGGIRLSFSKNPLGVRSPPTNGVVPTLPTTSQTFPPAPYVSNSAGFATAQHAPPGLIHPTAQHNMALYVGR